MKRVLTVLFVVTMAVSAVACGGDEFSVAGPTTQASPTPTNTAATCAVPEAILTAQVFRAYKAVSPSVEVKGVAAASYILQESQVAGWQPLNTSSQTLADGTVIYNVHPKTKVRLWAMVNGCPAASKPIDVGEPNVCGGCDSGPDTTVKDDPKEPPSDPPSDGCKVDTLGGCNPPPAECKVKNREGECDDPPYYPYPPKDDDRLPKPPGEEHHPKQPNPEDPKKDY